MINVDVDTLDLEVQNENPGPVFWSFCGCVQEMQISAPVRASKSDSLSCTQSNITAQRRHRSADGYDRNST